MFSEKQQKALENLENAFKKCKDLELSFAGVDSNLIVTTGETTWDALIGNQEGEIVNTHNAYRDSLGA